MSYDIKFFGHCNEEGHDKVWGYVLVGDDQLYNFWGKRGKRFAFQKHEVAERPDTSLMPSYRRDYYRNWEAPQFALLRAKAAEKCRPGRKSGQYDEVPVSTIETLVPGFFEEFEKQLTLAKLFDNFRGNRTD